MRRRDPQDPLLLQVLPRGRERESVAGFGDDPLAETSFGTAGVVRKYAGRALLITTGACPVHCRYCFRRAFPYATQLAARDDFEPALRMIAGDTGISEVILSGGDPLSLGNAQLADLIARLARIPALRTLRVHTRFPIMIPERVDDELLALLDSTRLRTVVVVHTNHPAEIDDSVAGALRHLRRVSNALLNQSVLLRDINDNAAALTELSERLFDCGVLPYYLHLLDRVTGAAHFDVTETQGRSLIDALRARLPGYLVPRLVREIPGEPGKTPIT